MSSTNSDSFFFFFFSNLDSFYSFSSLIAVARPFEIKLNNSGENEHPCFVPDLRGNVFSISLLSMMLAVSLLYMALIVLRYIPSMSTFWRIFFFYHKWMLNFVKSFCQNLLRWSYGFYSSLCSCAISYWFADIEKSLHLWDKFHLIMVYNLFSVLLDSDC